jgi:hypothetical protein
MSSPSGTPAKGPFLLSEIFSREKENVGRRKNISGTKQQTNNYPKFG